MGARGIPEANRAAMAGITPQEHRGLNPPAAVAIGMDVPFLPSKALLRYLSNFNVFINDAVPMPRAKYRAMPFEAFRTKLKIKFTSVNMISSLFYRWLLPIIFFAAVMNSIIMAAAFIFTGMVAAMLILLMVTAAIAV